MNFLDIVLGALLLFAMYNGLKNGLFVTLASLISLVVGIFIAIKFSHLAAPFITNYVSWSPKYIKVFAFGFTFLIVIIAIQALAKIFTKIADFAYLGWLNKLGGAVFSVLKTVLMLSVFLTLFQKINIKNFIVKKETLDASVFYNPIIDVAGFIYPSLEKWFEDFKKEV